MINLCVLFDFFVDSITVEFTMRVFFVSEINGPAQPVLRLSRPLDCCTISVRVKVDDRTAKSNYVCVMHYCVSRSYDEK